VSQKYVFCTFGTPSLIFTKNKKGIFFYRCRNKKKEGGNILNTEMMTSAYKMLYEIETTLRGIIERKMNDHYGLLWRKRFHEEGRGYYHDTRCLFWEVSPSSQRVQSNRKATTL
jgi:hypothetical protein